MIVSNSKLGYLTNNISLLLFLIIVSALLIRVYYFPHGIPLTEDGLYYFRYAVDTTILGHLPERDISNNGWPIFVSFFFFFVHSSNFLDYMTVQRSLSVLISVITVIPVYFLVCRFFDKKYGLIGALLFAFEPRMIQSSLLGITDTLYIFLVTLSLTLFLNSKKSLVYLAFCIAALSTLVRYEGMMLFVVISIMFFVRQKRDYNLVKRYGIAVGIFVLTISPLLYLRTVTVGNDGVTNSLVSGGEVYAIEATTRQDNVVLGILSFIITGFESLFKYLGWITIPYFLFLIPVGVYWLFRNRDRNKLTVIVSIIILSIPAFYAYSRGIHEARYLYVLYPILIILSISTINLVHKKIGNIIIPIIIVCVITSSIGFIEYKKTDYNHEREAFEIAKHMPDRAKAVNEYYPESKYVRVTGMINKFPILSNYVSFGPKVIPIEESSLSEFIEKNREEGLDHIVTDGRPNRPSFFNDVFYNEGRYPFLEKEFDSKELGIAYHVKIYRIDYEKFDSIRLGHN